MGMRYVASFEAVAVTALQDLFEISTPTDVVTVIHEIHVTQSSDAGDAQSEQLRFQILRGIGSTSGSGGTTETPQKQETGFGASGATVEVNNTTQAVTGGGSLTALFEECANIHVGWHYVPVPEARFAFSPGEEILIALPAAPGDSLTMSGLVMYEELGG